MAEFITGFGLGVMLGAAIAVVVIGAVLYTVFKHPENWWPRR